MKRMLCAARDFSETSLPVLQELDLRGAGATSAEELDSLIRALLIFTGIKSLTLSQTKIYQSSMASLAKFENLETLDLRNSDIREVHMRNISRYPTLKTLKLSFGVAKTTNVIERLLTIGGSSTLQRLDFKGGYVHEKAPTEETLLVLAKYTSLKTIEITGSSGTKNARTKHTKGTAMFQCLDALPALSELFLEDVTQTSKRKRLYLPKCPTSSSDPASSIQANS